MPQILPSSSGPVDYILVSVTFTTSFLSLLGTAFILFCYVILPQKRHIRHALIINLTLADFINAANNSSSGLWVLVNNRNLEASPGCTANGFIGQLSVQAVDFCILTITIVTLWIVTSSRSTADLSLGRIVLFCAASWIVPITTSCIALFTNNYGPAATNWCWIDQDPVYLRYVLTHGWRFMIIFTVLYICVYIQVYLRRMSHTRNELTNDELESDYRSINEVASLHEMANKDSGLTPDDNYGSDDEGMMVVMVESETSLPTHPGQNPPTLAGQRGRGRKRSIVAQHFSKVVTSITRRPSAQSASACSSTSDPRAVRSRSQQTQSIQRAMLLHAYPIFYILLWVPGIAMRIAQATGHDPYVLQVMQTSTQLIGFANAVTFGWNERIGLQLREKLRGVVAGSDRGSSSLALRPDRLDSV
ncbi:hypothetical protein BP5796_09634 [Coleophoma crateriformis]|uniref:Glucose receptor Git3-like N-terminal domain-containing protein n=1 Tax=Coleophoma crateriformis TaxID=565419 RepID=A0A3D8QYQ0_9HELO|nr:hypothetical protein BP5796_09634 [Coleophoma crateriformis]